MYSSEGRCNVIVLYLRARSGEKSDDSKDRLYEELEQVFDHFTKYHMEILLGDFNAKLGRGDIFKLEIGNESLHLGSNDNGVGIVKSTTSKNLVVWECNHSWKKQWHRMVTCVVLKRGKELKLTISDDK